MNFLGDQKVSSVQKKQSKVDLTKVQGERGDFEMDAPDEEAVKNNPFVLSFIESVGPLSFVDYR